MCVYMCARARLLSKHALYSEKGEGREGGDPASRSWCFLHLLCAGPNPGGVER